MRFPLAIPAIIAIVFLVAACGPRGSSPAAVDRGFAPSIIDPSLDTQFTNPPVKNEAGNIVFPIVYRIRAQDMDQNMKSLEIAVRYDDPCTGMPDERLLTVVLNAADSVSADITISGTTMDKVRVPTDCFAINNVFRVRGNIVDRRGNRSNTHQDVLTIGAGQGSTGQA